MTAAAGPGSGSSTVDEATAYARSVAGGAILASRLVRLACTRHLRDLEDGAARGLTWKPALAQRAIEFVREVLCLAGGEHEGQPFHPQPWQAFLLGSLFGWLGPDGYRRFRQAYVEIGKGNGKSPLAAAIGLYMLVADGEHRAEVYAAATKVDQAQILFRDAIAMVDQSPELAARLEKSGARGREWNLAYHATGSFFRPISSDDKGQSGPRPHCGLIDEVHEHRTPVVIDMMRAGRKGRRQPLIFEITNSGHDRDTICWRHHEYSAQVLDGRLSNDAWFAYVCGLDPCLTHGSEGKTQPVVGCPECDDWRDERTWPKANPNLGVSITLTYLREQVREAQGMPAMEGTVKRLNFCWWTESETAWLPVELWARGDRPVDAAALHGRRCYGGLDVASKVDVAAYVLCFPGYPSRGDYALACWFWLPQAQAEARQHGDGIPYLYWAEQGLITLTPGDTIDQDAIEEAVKATGEVYQLEEVAYDPWNATQMATHLQEHCIRVVEFGQNIRNFNEPTKEFESQLKQGHIVHGDNPVLNWMAGNVTVITDRSGNVRPVKPEHHSLKKVDGIVAAVMAFARAILHPEGDYGDDGVFAV